MSNSLSVAQATTSAAASNAQKSTLSGGKIAGIAVSLAAVAVVILVALAFLCLRRRKPTPPPTQVYPEEAYLYDPPMWDGSRLGLTQNPVNGNAGYGYGNGAAGMSSRPMTPPNHPGAEREGLLGPAPIVGAGAASRSASDRGGYYAPTPHGEADLGDGMNPFVDQPTTEYNAGEHAAAVERTSMQSSPGRSGEVISPQMRAVRRAWGWE
jgi:hypothetical protein